MALIKEHVLRFRQSVAADVVSNRFRVRPANTPAAYDDPSVTLPKRTADADGYTRVPLTDFAAPNLEGRFDIHVTAVDTAGNESDFLEVDNQLFDISPPAAPTDGSIE